MKEVINLPASIHDRLANLARAHHRQFQEYFYYYVMERFLYRLVRSPYAQSFILKGGLMFQAWGLPYRRPTRDIDVQGNINNSEELLVAVVKEICLQPVEPDGLSFNPDAVRAERITENAEYQGVRVYFEAHLGNAHLQSHIDCSFGNEIRPAEIWVTYPTLLGMNPFQIRGYPIETAIAEKFQTMIFWEIVNSRMRDFYDIYLLSEQFEIPGSTLVEAIAATFAARHTDIPSQTPVALSAEFAQARQPDWTIFLSRTSIADAAPDDLLELIQHLRLFLLPPMHAARVGSSFPLRWPPAGPWIGDYN